MPKPTLNQPGWGTVLNDHLDQLELTTATKETPAGAQAKANAAQTAAEATAATTRAPGPVVSPPTGFAFSVLTIPTIHRLGAGRFYADLDLEAMRPPAGVTYYVAPLALGTGSGVDAANAGTIPDMIAKADVGTIIYLPGEYFRNTHTTSTTAKSINHLAAGPGVKVTGWNSTGSTVWTLTSGSIYQTTRSATAQVVDVENRESWGDYTKYEQKADLASLTAAGQWAIDGSTVYVWCIGDTDLSIGANRVQIRLGLSGTFTALNITGGTHYVRGVHFEGQAFGVAISGGTLLAEDCTFRYSLVDAIPASGGTCITRRCSVSSAATDGLSYSNATEFIEVDNDSHHNGHVGGGTNNATTAHATARGIRVGGDYDVAGGPVVADVNSSRSWNLGCRAGESTAAAAQNHSWRSDATGFEGDPATLWLDECTADTATNAYKVTGSGIIHLHASRESNVNAYDTSSVGTLDYYDA